MGFMECRRAALSVTGSALAPRSSAPLLSGVIRLPFEGYRGAGIAELRRFEAWRRIRPAGPIRSPRLFSKRYRATVVSTSLRGNTSGGSRDGRQARSPPDRRRPTGGLRINGYVLQFRARRHSPRHRLPREAYQRFGPSDVGDARRSTHDVWSLGEHNGTSGATLWSEGSMSVLPTNSAILFTWCADLAIEFHEAVRPKGIGMMRGLQFS